MEKTKITSKEQARQKAIDYQRWFGMEETQLSWSEIADWTQYFHKLGQKYHLMREYKENGIL